MGLSHTLLLHVPHLTAAHTAVTSRDCCSCHTLLLHVLHRCSGGHGVADRRNRHRCCYCLFRVCVNTNSKTPFFNAQTNTNSRTAVLCVCVCVKMCV